MMVEEVKTRGEMATSAAFTTHIPSIQHPTPPPATLSLASAAWHDGKRGLMSPGGHGVNAGVEMS